jgi:peptide/nickel transport system substrate-binding protein
MMEKDPRPVLLISLLAALALLATGCATPTPAPTVAPTAAPVASQPTSVPTVPVVSSPTAAATKPSATLASAITAATQAPAATTATTKAQPTGKLVAVRQDEPPTLDWKDTTNEPQTFVTWSVMEGLTNKDPRTGKVNPVLAESWTWDKANTWTFKLRKGVQFHNGEPFNAAAVVYTFQRIAAKDQNAQLAQHLQNMDSVTAPDDYTVVVKTKTPDPMFDSRVQFLKIGAPKFSQASPDKLATTLIGTGPYKFVGWQKGQSIQLTANENYWGDMPKIKGITILFRAEPAVRAAMVRTGEADLAWTINPEDIPNAPKVVQYQDLRTIAVRPDTTGQNPALADVRVRQAMMYAIDMKTATDAMFKNVAVQVKGNQQVAPAVLGYDPNMKPWPYDPDKAKKLLADAKAAGVPINTPMTLYERGVGWFPRDNEFGEYLVNSWNQIGLNVKLVVQDSAAWVTMWGAVGPQDKHGDLLYTLHSVELMDYSHSADRMLYSDARYSTWHDPQTDQMLKAAAQLTGDERAKAYQDIAHYLEDKVPMFVFGSLIQTHGINAKLQWNPRPDGVPTFWEMSFSN